MSADGPASEFYYDGKKMMAYAPAENLVAIADAPALSTQRLSRPITPQQSTFHLPTGS